MINQPLYLRYSKWTKRVIETLNRMREMLRLLWQTQPLSVVGLVLIDLMQSVIPLAQAWITKLLFDLLANNIRTNVTATLPTDLFALLSGQIVLAVIGHGLGLTSTYLNAELGRQLNLKIQTSVFRKINDLKGLAPFENPLVQNTIQLASQGGEMGASQSLGLLMSLLRSAITLGGFLGILMSFSPLLAGLVTLAALPQLYIQLKMGHKRFDLAVANSPKQRLSTYYESLLSTVHFAKELRLFNLGEYFLEAYRRLTLDLHQTQRTQEKIELRWQTGFDLLSNLVSGGTFVVVILQAFAGRISLGTMTFYTSAVGSVQGALSSIVFSLANMNESVLFFSHYNELMALQQPIVISDKPYPIVSLTHGIEIQNVSFRYSEKHAWVLNNVSLNIPAGQRLALVGLNGAGKTTLVKLLMRLYDPSEGRILWDGVDFLGVDPISLRRRIGTIFQDFMHFDLTAFENIALGDVEMLRFGKDQAERVQHAARLAGVDGVINAFPLGYQTILSRWLAEDGQGMDLSGGEWQKIALARMFVRDADLLILDEPTASLDAQAEYDFFSRFLELTTGKTTLLISHRFSTVRMADRIAVLENGCIIELGSHDELIKLGNRYAKLYNMQAERYR